VTGAWDARLWIAQRASAAVLAVCVLAHLAIMIYAARQGLSAAHILARTRGSWVFATYYAVFVVAAGIHVPLGLRAVCQEWLGWRRGLDWALAAYALLVLAMGLRAVYAVVAGA
jgi:fumarate reductase subunit C